LQAIDLPATVVRVLSPRAAALRTTAAELLALPAPQRMPLSLAPDLSRRNALWWAAVAVGLSVVVGPGLYNVLFVIALFTWFYPARIVRNATMSGSKLLYVDAARSVGARPRRLLLVHILPQVWGPLLVFGTSIVANNILFESGLSYLGVGVPPPTASWGQMLSDGVNSGLYRVVPALAVVPGLALVLTMLAFNLLGDGLRDAIDPKARR
jgi:ABC-type dipeptide/oligopeptide/nickel transport system permease subunit